MLGKPKSQREVRSVLGLRLLGKQDKKEMSDEWELSHILRWKFFIPLLKKSPLHRVWQVFGEGKYYIGTGMGIGRNRGKRGESVLHWKSLDWPFGGYRAGHISRPRIGDRHTIKRYSKYSKYSSIQALKEPRLAIRRLSSWAHISSRRIQDRHTTRK